MKSARENDCHNEIESQANVNDEDGVRENKIVNDVSSYASHDDRLCKR